jgi:hypothetical protein
MVLSHFCVIIYDPITIQSTTYDFNTLPEDGCLQSKQVAGISKQKRYTVVPTEHVFKYNLVTAQWAVTVKVWN